MNFKSSGSQGFYQEITGGSSSRGGVAGPYSTYQQSYGGGERDLNNGAGDEDSDDHQMLYRRGGGGEGSSSSTAAAAAVEREHMFDKVVTPSDVGKLNRLVIPKQHAEKYFPLDSSANEKGLLLNFEDRNGKPWRFRYSYWNSSQSYVMTKGWSRFVKEKKLDAGDIVSFQRGVGDHAKDRLFIDWRRRPDAPVDLLPPPSSHHHHLMMRSSVPHPPWTTTTPLFNYSHFLQPPTGYGPYTYGNPCPPGSLVYLRSAAAAGGGGVFSPQHGGASAAVAGQRVQGDQMVFDSVPVVQGKAAAKRLRLFGVNMDCPISETDECENHILSSTTLPFHHHLPPRPPPPPPQNFDSFSSSSSSVPSLQFLRHHQNEHHEDKLGKGSMSLDLDI